MKHCYSPDRDPPEANRAQNGHRGVPATNIEDGRQLYRFDLTEKTVIHSLNGALEASDGKTLWVATMFSGTDTPIIGLWAIRTKKALLLDDNLRSINNLAF